MRRRPATAASWRSSHALRRMRSMNNDRDVSIDDAAQRVWNYLRVDDALAPADSIVIFGGNDIRVAEWGAKVFLMGLAPLIVCCGAYGKGTADWIKPEAEAFRETCEALG